MISSSEMIDPSDFNSLKDFNDVYQYRGDDCHFGQFLIYSITEYIFYITPGFGLYPRIRVEFRNRNEINFSYYDKKDTSHTFEFTIKREGNIENIFENPLTYIILSLISLSWATE